MALQIIWICPYIVLMEALLLGGGIHLAKLETVLVREAADASSSTAFMP